jgi:hypothetical protein
MSEDTIQYRAGGAGTEGHEYPPIADGTVYEAKLLTAQVRTAPWLNDDGTEQRRVNFKFEIVSDDVHNGRWLWGSTPETFNDNERCKFRNWAEALLGKKLVMRDLDEFRLANLVGLHCRIIVERKDKLDREKGVMIPTNRVRDVFASKENYARMNQTSAFDDEPF